MKLFKLISVCVISVLLVVSIVLNIFLLSGFKFTKESCDKVPQPPVVLETEDQSDRNEFPKNDPSTQTYVDSSKEEVKEETNYLYEDNNLKVTYVGKNPEPIEPTYLFKLENTSTKTITVLFTDVYVDGRQVFISGLTCEKLLPGTSVTEDFVLSNKEFEEYTTSPTNVTFKIKLVNSKSYLDLYESEQINLTF